MKPIESLIREVMYTASLNIGDKYTYRDNNIPRVTDILEKTIHEPHLLEWANSLGFRRLSYKKELQKAADIGTTIHTEIYNYLKTKELGDSIGFSSFILWCDIVKSYSTVIAMEESITCEYFGGTYDLLVRIQDKNILVDFKTGNYTYYTHFLQLAAYKYILNNKDIDIDGVLVLKLDKRFPNFIEYYLDLSIEDHLFFIEECTKAFLSLVYSFFNIYYIEKLYKDINFHNERK